MAAAGRWRAGLVLLAVALGLCGTGAEQTEEHLKREHSLSKPYQGVGSASSGLWDLLGNAMVMTQFIRLTPDVQSKQGAVWNRVVSGGHRGEGRERSGTGMGRGRESGTGTRMGQRNGRGRDNHDIISLKLYQLTVERTPEEEKRDREVFLPVVDNLKLPGMEAPLEPMSGLALFLIVFFSLVAIVFAIVIGIIVGDAVVISGRKLARQIRQEVRHEVEQWVAAGNRRPHLSVVLVGENPASHSYVLNKTKAAADVGISSETILRPASITEEELLELIGKLNSDAAVDGLLVQLPLPGIPTLGRNVVVAGRSKNVGMPIAMLLHTDGSHERPGGDATVTISHRYTPKEQLKQHTIRADIVVAAAEGLIPPFSEQGRFVVMPDSTISEVLF
ncbi:hypothetical protein TURU_016890 [Turdus rufiventris]|nr:hypothetical protein TURU_016890 [Turdus rufiventris]